MENKFSFAAVGVFVVGFAIALLTLVVWLTVGTEKVSYLPYKVVTTESVSGLSINSSVNYKGVDVGIVRNIQLNEKDPRYVIISLDIIQGTPIKADTEAVLTSRGITGLVGVSLSGGQSSSPNIVPTENDPIPSIKNGASLAKRLDTAFNDVTKSMSDLSDKLSLVITEDNAKNINQILTNMERLTSNLADSSEDVSLIVSKIEPKLERGLEVFESFGAIANNVKKVSEDLQVTLNNADTTLNSWNQAAIVFQNLGQSVRGQIPNLNSTFTELNIILYQTSQLINQLNNEPNALIMGKSKPKRGPGE